ncbi:bifunctional ADP-heptose synthase [uncultured Sunxiuqinia sp.]|uniref:bifunctional heptose 7-phosphate kinase/heptose 1-phosphate adenyltransferase n=1 Tax=uncultured Sunxiuqinia sp. TaxID=1573825 RepID=UPI002AA71284|nr:bifunctional ADP-heptose synthase [uncultured Sunxiuqinia sp.]
MEKLKVEEVFKKFSNIRALVVGDAMVDSYMWGVVDRISSEAPIPILTINRQENRLGGAANVSLNLQALGATPVLVSMVGNDMKGDIFMQLLEKRNLTDAGILRSESRETTVKTRILSRSQQVVRVDEETAELISSQEEDVVFQRIEKLVEQQNFEIVIFVDYDKGIITQSLIERVTVLAKSKGILIAVDPKKRNFNNYSEVNLFKPNFKEFKEGLKLNFDKRDFQSILKAAEQFKKEKKLEIIFITLSELGVIISNGVKQNHFPAQIRDIADVSGAGDTVIAVASLCLAAGLPTKFMAQLSNLAGGLVCEKSGVVPIDSEQLRVEARKIKISK